MLENIVRARHFNGIDQVEKLLDSEQISVQADFFRGRRFVLKEGNETFYLKYNDIVESVSYLYKRSLHQELQNKGSCSSDFAKLRKIGQRLRDLNELGEKKCQAENVITQKFIHLHKWLGNRKWRGYNLESRRREKIENLLNAKAPLSSKEVEEVLLTAFKTALKVSAPKPKTPKLTTKVTLSPPPYAIMHKQLAEVTLKRFFGPRLVDDVLNMYHLKDAPTLTIHDFNALVTGIKANITYADLDEIKKGPLYAILQEDVEIYEKERQPIALLDVLREKTPNIDPSRAPKEYREQLEKDISFIELTRLYKEFAPHEINSSLKEFEKFGEEEFLSRDIIYGLYATPNSQFSDGVIFATYEWDEKTKTKNLVLKQAIQVYSEKGMHAALILPAVIDTTKPVTAEIVFRGTYDIDSVKRDIHPWDKNYFSEIEGAGAKSFRINRKKLNENIENELHKLRDSGVTKFNLKVMGHSLGGSDTCREVIYIAYKIGRRHYADILSVNVYTFNSPAIDEKSCLNFNEYAARVKTPFVIRHFKVKRDPIPAAGKTLPGFWRKKKPLPKNIKVSIFVLEHPIATLTKQGIINKMQEGAFAHTAHCFGIMDARNPDTQNKLHVAAVYTNNPEDATLPFSNTDEKELQLRLVTSPGKAINSFIKAAVSLVKRKVESELPLPKSTVQPVSP